MDTSKGAAVDETLDFRLIGPIDFQWVRYYDSSLSRRRLALGWGHTHDLDRTLRFDANGLRYVARVGPDIGFPPVLKDGKEVTSDGFRLRRLSLLCYEIHHHGEPSAEFEFGDVSVPARPKRLFRGHHEIRFSYSPEGRWERIVDSMGRVIRVVEEPDGRILSLTLVDKLGKPGMVLVSYRYDGRGNLIGTTDSSGHGFNCAYDAENRLIRRTGRKGFSFHFQYDSKGRCIRSTGDDRMHEVSLDYDPSGRITKVTHADGGVWTYIFDEGGRLARVIDPLGGIQTFVLDKNGRLVQEVDPNNNATHLIYDKAGSAVAKVAPLRQWMSLPEDPNAADARVHRVAANPAEYEYGRLLKIDKATLPHAGEVTALPVPLEARNLVVTRPVDKPASGGEESFQPPPLGPNWWPKPKRGRVFNDLGKLVRQDDDWGRNRRWDYDASGNVAEYEDFDGGKWSYDCGKWHLRLGETNAIGATVSLSYNPSGKLATCIDAGGTVSEYGYNLKDHLVAVRRHGVVRDEYTRDAAGNLIAKHAADGRLLLQFEIGPGNVIVKRTLASGDEHSFEYDKAGRHLAAASKKDQVEFAYDALGNRTSEKRNGCGVEHRFQGWWMPAQSVFFGSFTVCYERLADGTLVLTDPGGKKHQIHFHAHGLVTRQFSNGSIEVAQYDHFGRCLFKFTSRGTGTAWRRRFQWSGEGELLRVRDSSFGETCHEYDAAHRLRRRFLPGGRSEVYELDRADNLVRQPGLDDVLLQEGNRLSSANGLSFAYNDRNHIAERQTPDGPVQYSYDSRDQLVRINMPDGAWEAEYDALGRRSRKTFKGQTTEYYWNTDQLIAEVQRDGRLRLYVYAHPMALCPVMFLDYDSVNAPPESGRRYFVFADQVGTPCLIEDDSGTAVWRARIDPYGRADIVPEAKIEFNLRFPGHYFDRETGLHHNRFRYYDPVLGRYIQSDPWGIAGGYNLYAYCSNPLLHADVRGLGEQDETPDEPAQPDAEATQRIRVLTPEEQALAQQLVSITRGLAQSMIDNEDQGRGPVLTGVVDPKFPDDGPFFGQNTGIPDDLHPVLQANLDQHNADVAAGRVVPSPTAGNPGDHSEINAFDQALKNRDARTGQQSTQADLDDMMGHNVNLKNASSPNDDGTRTPIPAGQGCPPRCDNCGPITTGNGNGPKMVDQNGQLTDGS